MRCAKLPTIAVVPLCQKEAGIACFRWNTEWESSFLLQLRKIDFYLAFNCYLCTYVDTVGSVPTLLTFVTFLHCRRLAIYVCVSRILFCRWTNAESVATRIPYRGSSKSNPWPLKYVQKHVMPAFTIFSHRWTSKTISPPPRNPPYLRKRKQNTEAVVIPRRLLQ